jgi:hypothetical protein
MRKLKTTMLFIGISVTSFAQNFEGMDSKHYDDGVVVFTAKANTIEEAIEKSMYIFNNNNIDTSSVVLHHDDDMLIFSSWIDDNDTNIVYVFFCQKIKNNKCRIAVIQQENVYTEYFHIDKKLLVYDPK